MLRPDIAGEDTRFDGSIYVRVARTLLRAEAAMIRKATANDTGEILDCLRAAFEPFRSSYTGEAFLDTTLDARKLDERRRVMTLLVAERDAMVIGTIAWSLVGPDEARIRGMAVAPQFQGAGIAQELLDAVEAEARDAGCTRATLGTTGVLERAIRFYERNGYRLTGAGDFFGMELRYYEKSLTINEAAKVANVT